VGGTTLILYKKFNMKQRGEIYQVLRIAVPAAVANVGHLIYGITDSLMVGRLLGTEYLAAVALAGSFQFILLSLGIGSLSLFASIISMHNAKKEEDQIRFIFKNSLIFAVIMGVILGTILILSSPLLKYVTTSDLMVARSQSYIQILSLCFLFNLPFVAFEKASEGLGDTRISMFIIFLCNILNAFLNYGLILGKFGLPELGLNGAAYATVITTFCELLFIILLFPYFKKLKVVYKKFWKFKFDLKEFIRLFKLSLPAGLHIFFENSMFYICTTIASLVSVIHAAGYQITILLTSGPFVIMYATMGAVNVRIAHHFALRNFKMIKKIIFTSIIFVSGAMFCFVILYYLTGDFIPSLFLGSSAEDKTVVGIVGSAIAVIAFFEVFDGLQMLIAAILRGMQDTIIPSLISFACFWAAAIPFAYYLGYVKRLGVLGIWLALGSAMIIGFHIFILRLFYILKKQIRTGLLATHLEETRL
jgi:MATE family multidrug resistance protein